MLEFCSENIENTKPFKSSLDDVLGHLRIK